MKHMKYHSLEIGTIFKSIPEVKTDIIRYIAPLA